MQKKFHEQNDCLTKEIKLFSGEIAAQHQSHISEIQTIRHFKEEKPSISNSMILKVAQLEHEYKKLSAVIKELAYICDSNNIVIWS